MSFVILLTPRTCRRTHKQAITKLVNRKKKQDDRYSVIWGFVDEYFESLSKFTRALVHEIVDQGKKPKVAVQQAIREGGTCRRSHRPAITKLLNRRNPQDDRYSVIWGFIQKYDKCKDNKCKEDFVEFAKAYFNVSLV